MDGDLRTEWSAHQTCASISSCSRWCKMAPSEETSSGGSTEGTSQRHNESTSPQDADNLPKQEEDEDEVRQKCLFLLNELVSRTEEANRHRQPYMEGGPVQCRLPLTKVSLALQAYVNRATASHSPNVFQGQKTVSDESCDAITPFTPSSTKLPGSPSIASATPAETSTAKVVRTPQSFLFQVELTHQVIGEDGQKWYVCDICQNKYDRCYSLKRHYLHTHINHRYLTERDIFNYSIVVNDHVPLLEKKDSGVVFPSLYCCHQCTVLFDVKDELVKHLSLHPEDLKCSSKSSDEITPSTSKSLEQEIAPTSESQSADSSQSHTLKNVSHCSVIAHDLSEFPKPRPASQIECLYCDKSFSTMTMHKRHMYRSHPQQSSAQLSPTQEKNTHHKCTFCTSEEDTPASQDETDSLKYACSICCKVFDDYVAKCRHHRKVHKGVQSLSSVFGGVRSPGMSSDSRSQSPALDVCKRSLDNDTKLAVEVTVNSGILPQKTCDDSSQKTVCLLHKTSDSVSNMCNLSPKTDVDDSRLSQIIVSDLLDSVYESVQADEHLPQQIVSNLDYLLEKLVGDSKSSLEKDVCGLSGGIISDVNHDSQKNDNNLSEITSEMNYSSSMEKTISDSGDTRIEDTAFDIPQYIENDTSQETSACESTNSVLLEEPPATVGSSNVEEVCDLSERIVDDLIVPQMHDNEEGSPNACEVIIDMEEKAIKSKHVIEDSKVTITDCSETEKKSTVSTIDEVVESVVRKYSVPCESEDSDEVKKTPRSTIDETLDSVIQNCCVTDDEKRNSVDEILDFVVGNYKEDSASVPKKSSIDETLDYVIKNFQPFSKPIKFQQTRYKRPLKKNLKIEPSLTLSKKLVKRGRKTLIGEQKVNHKLKKNNVSILLEKNKHSGDDVNRVELDDGQNFTKSVNSIQKGNPKLLEEESATESNRRKVKKNSKLSEKDKTVGKISVKTSRTYDEIYKSDKKHHVVSKVSLQKTRKIISIKEVKVHVKKKRNQSHSVDGIDGNVKEVDKVKQRTAKRNHKLSDSENEIKKSKQKSTELKIATEPSNLAAAEGIHRVLDGVLDKQEKSTNNEFIEAKSKQMEAGRVLRSSLTSTAKSPESLETRGRSLRSSSAPGTDPDGNRAVRKRLPKSEEATNVKNETKSDSDDTITRGTRLRKFSRRVRGDMVQENQHLDPETLFYCRIAGNIRENLLHHLDGKLECEEGDSNDRHKELRNVPSADCSLSQEDKHHHHHNHHRIPWEKFNFPKNYDGRCKEGMVCLASYIKDMSHLDISTQLTMRQNFQRLSMAPPNYNPVQTSIVELGKDDVVGFSKTLCLNAKVLTEQPRRRSLRSAASRGREVTSAMLGGAASTFTASAGMRRWSSAEAMVELSGEWVRPRSYICAACGLVFNDLWDVEDHKYNQHPNVWCTHYEFEQTSDSSRLSVRDLCRRFLLVRDLVESVPLPTLNSEVKCTKCERGFSVLPELHRHILECGGDTTWMLLPSPSSSGRRSRKWRPFGSRRRRQQGSHRRGMKRNIPNTPVKQFYRNSKHRTAGGDSDSIQRMLANLPAKRATRRVIQFSEDEMKTRSQGTMHSVSVTSGVPLSPHRMAQKPDPVDQSRKLGRSPKKMVKGQIIVKKVVRAKFAVAAREEEETEKRRATSVSPVISKQEAIPPTVDAKPPAIHKSRNRKKPVAEIAKVEVDEFDVDISNVGSAETSDILAAMRIALLEGVITEKVSSKKRKPGEPMTLKKKAKIGQSNLEEQFLRNKGYTHPDEVSGEPIICKGCGMQFDNGSAEMRHRKTCIYLPGGEESNSAVKKKKKLSPTGRIKKPEVADTRSLSASPVRCRKKKQDRKETKRSSSLGTVEEKKKKIGKRKNLLKEKKTNIISPATSDIDDRMPELQKEEPLDDLKTQTPSPKQGEDLCDIPILSPVGCEPPVDELEDKQAKYTKNDKSIAVDLGKGITGNQIEDKVTKQVEKHTDSDDDIPLIQKLGHLKQSHSSADNVPCVTEASWHKKSNNNVHKIQKVVQRKDSSSDDDVPLLEKVDKSSSEVSTPPVEKVTHHKDSSSNDDVPLYKTASDRCFSDSDISSIGNVACYIQSSCSGGDTQKITCRKESSSDDDIPLLEKVTSSRKSEDNIPLVEEKESNNDDGVPLVEKAANHKGYSNGDSICPKMMTSNKLNSSEDSVPFIEKESSLDVEVSCQEDFSGNYCGSSLIENKESSINNASKVEEVAFHEDSLSHDNSPLGDKEFMTNREISIVEELVKLERSCRRNEAQPKQSSKCLTNTKSNRNKLSPKEIYTGISSEISNEVKTIPEFTVLAGEDENLKDERDASTVSQEHTTGLDNFASLEETLPVLGRSISTKKQKRKVIRRRNSTPWWDRKRKSVSRVQETMSKVQDPTFEELVCKIQDPIEELVNKIQDPIEELVNKIQDPIELVNKIQDPIEELVNKIQDPIEELANKIQDPIVEVVGKISDPVVEEDSTDDLLPISKLKEVIQKKTVSNEDCLKVGVDLQTNNVNDSKLKQKVGDEINFRPENNLDVQQEELVNQRDILQPIQKKKRNRKIALPPVQLDNSPPEQNLKPEKIKRRVRRGAQVDEMRRRGRSKGNLFTKYNVGPKQVTEIQNMDEEQNQLPDSDSLQEGNKTEELEKKDQLEAEEVIENFLQNDMDSSHNCLQIADLVGNFENELQASIDLMEDNSRLGQDANQRLEISRKNTEKESEQVMGEEKDNFRPIERLTIKKKKGLRHVIRKHNRKRNLIETSNLIDQEHIVMPCSNMLGSEGEQLITSFVEADSKCEFPGDSDHLMSVAEDTNISVCEETSNLIGGEENITDVLSAVIGGEDNGETDGIHLLIEKEKEICEVVAETKDEPLRQARRTRCNTSYEELYAWSDVTTETEDSSQDLPDASIMAALCQEGEATYEQLAAMLVSGEHLFPSVYRRKKKKKLRNNSRQYRNGQLRRRRRRKQKLKKKLLKKSKRVNEFIVTDIETGQEESQDSCESTAACAEPGGDEISKPTRRKRKKKMAGEGEKAVYCDVCDKHYSTNYSLMKHKQSITHRKFSEQQTTEEVLHSDKEMPVALEDPSVLQNIEDSTVFQNIEKVPSAFEDKETNCANFKESEMTDEGGADDEKQMSSVAESVSSPPVEDKSHDEQSCPEFENVTVGLQNNTANLEAGGSASSELNQNSAQWTDWSQQNWSSEQENGNQWLYGNQWNWGRDMGWNAESSQDDGTFFQSSTASLGSILDSVNQILDNERSGDGLTSGSEYQSYMDLLQPENCEDGTGGLRELQQAMGATDEEMAMLQQLGEGNWPLEDADIMDLDNQKTATSSVQQDTSSAATTTMKDVQHKQSMASTSSAETTERRVLVGRGGLRNQDILLAHYESKDMVCPVCSRRFLGLSALRAHLNAAHNSSTRHHTQNDLNKRSRIGNNRPGGDTNPVRHVCEVCKELLPDEQGLADHVEVAHTERNKPADYRSEGLGHGSRSGSGGDEGLRSHMTSALGGLLTRALNNFLGKNRSQPSSPATQTQSSPKPSQVQSVSKLFSKSLKTTGRRHSSGPVDEQPFNCMDCDVRFSSESNRNRHIARAHRSIQYRRLSTDTDSAVTTEESAQPVAEMAVTPPPCKVVAEPVQVEEPPLERRTRVKVDMMEKVDGLNEEDSIKAKAVAALRALNSKDRRTRNGFAGNNGPVLWTGVSCNKSRGNNSEERFRFPLVRKTPPSGNRFASLAEKKKKRATADVVVGQAKENIEDMRDAAPISYDVYEFQDEVEQVGEYSMRGKATGSNQQEEVPLQDETTDNIEISGTASRIPEIMDEMSRSSEDMVVKDTVASKSTLKKRLFSKKKRWHRIIVDSGEETSDAETLTELRHEKSRGVKRRHSVPAGVLVEDRQSEKKTKTKQSPRGSQRRSTKTDLLMSVFAKSRQRCNTASAAARPVSLFCTSYESESDSSSLAAGNLGVSSEDEGKRPHQRKQKVSAL